MIVSNRYGFIFVKNARVAGTSLEMALSKFLGDEDIITPVAGDMNPYRETERLRRGFAVARNFEKSPYRLRATEVPRFVKGQMRSRFYRDEGARLYARSKLPKKYWGHMSAEEIRSRVGTSRWDSYYKFTVERNPWDRLVAAYSRKKKQGKMAESFREFVMSSGPARTQFDRYTVNGKVGMDRILRYDRLYEGLSEISNLLSFPENVGDVMASMSANAGHRSSRRYQDCYHADTKEVVDLYFAREIRLMGFAFEEGGDG